MSFVTDLQYHLENSGDFCALVDASGRIVASNTRPATAMTANPAHCNQLLTLHSSCPCDNCHIRHAFETGGATERELSHPQLGPVRLLLLPLTGANGRAELAALRLTVPSPAPEELVRRTLNSLPQAIFECDLQGKLLSVNLQCARQFSITEAKLSRGLDLMQMVTIADRQRLKQLLQRALQEECRQTADFIAKTDQERTFPATIHLIPVKEQGALTILRGVIENISQLTNAKLELSESQQRCQHLVRHDQLTGLPNRNQLMEWLDDALARYRQEGKPLTVMLLDIDRFKQVVDFLGDGCGDRVLCEIARRLEGQRRRNDLLARLNGNEFVLVYSNVFRPKILSQLAQRLLKELHAPILVDEQVVHLTASIGIAICQPENPDGARLLRQAAIAMNEVKARGGNQYAFFSQEMQARREEIFRLEKQMREALQMGEFSLHYQPQIDLKSGNITGVEALVRWNGPDDNNPSPETFITVAEESGLIHPLGAFILHEACVQNLRWQQNGLPPIKVTVNISAKQFSQPNFVDRVKQTLTETGLSAEWLELEITESAIMANIKDARKTMRSLQQEGVRFAIDDFGTGHSSLNYLRQLPLSKLKIDRSFVLDIPGNRDNEKLIVSILALARSFNLQTVAEGIETQAQLDYLQQLDCDLGQGFLFSRPVAPDAIPALLSEYKP